MNFDRNNETYQKDLDIILQNPFIKNFERKNILVCGATGLLGSCLIDAFMKYNKENPDADIEIYAMSRDFNKAQDMFAEYLPTKKITILAHDVKYTFADYNIIFDYIFYVAGSNHPIYFANHPIDTMLDNIMGIKNTLDYANINDSKVLYLSSGETYGNSIDNMPFEENTNGKLNLNNARACYTEAKRSCEALCQAYISEKNSMVKIARLCRAFGPTVTDKDSKVSTQFIKNGLSKKEIVLKSNGNQMFSYIYVIDAVNALIYIMCNGDNGQAYNVSSEKCNIMLRDFAKEVAKQAGTTVTFELPEKIEKEGYSIASYALLNNKKLRDLGYESAFDMPLAINHTLEILKNSK